MWCSERDGECIREECPRFFTRITKVYIYDYAVRCRAYRLVRGIGGLWGYLKKDILFEDFNPLRREKSFKRIKCWHGRDAPPKYGIHITGYVMRTEFVCSRYGGVTIGYIDGETVSQPHIREVRFTDAIDRAPNIRGPIRERITPFLINPLEADDEDWQRLALLEDELNLGERR